MEPASQAKRRRLSDTLREPGRTLRPTREDIVRRLKEVRSYSATHVDEMVVSLSARLTACPEMDVDFAPDAGRMVEVVRKIAAGRTIAVNRAAVIDNELKKGLISSGCTIIDSYDGRFSPSPDSPPNGHGAVGAMSFDSRLESFGKPSDLVGRRTAAIEKEGMKDFVGLLGINAISAEDGSVVMLQHMSNIGRIYERAADIILVAGLDKIVRNLDDALFQTKCMAVFGAEALPLRPMPDEGDR